MADDTSTATTEEKTPTATGATPPPFDTTAPGTEDANKQGNYKRRKALVILLIIFIAGGWFGLKWLIKSKTHIETDNAFIEARIVPVSAKVSGTVTRVLVNDNQLVKQGDLLVELDDRDYRVKVAQTEAGVGMAENETGGEYQKVEGARASLQSARATYDQAVLDLTRGEALFSREVIPKEQLDRLRTAKRVADSKQKEAAEALKRAQAEAGLSNRDGNKARIAQRKAQMDEAKLQLSYTKVFAPRDGYITRKSIEPGTNIQAGQSLMALVPLQDAWITANYKESQLTYIKPGQKVEFTVDTYPGRTFSGSVDSIMAGTGAAFSLLPPENATGNYVKVVQRIPVKITIDNSSDPEHLLRVGMSVIPTVLVGRSTAGILKDLNPFN
ncbi:HlyD family secretion protein [Oryzomonas rubra]|uniref:HlyD family secretion protein n=1 Tax=Oryzomonas rubra TaxID=2509454 RepID=A0A5A9XR23_9BACT|nr:HlyD family secretion protein [Oryzomonas rubra]KAA0894995.1 HlyD family secretion protein [Oryzomonas rubra]